MTISSALSNATTGLSAAQKRADVVANNIANALTPGYSRREVSVSEQRIGASGGGVSVDGVKRATDAVLSRERRAADALSARDQTIAAAYQAMNRSLGEPGDPYSLFSQYQNFEGALRALGDSPESGPQQALTLDAAKSLVSTLNSLASETQRARHDADREIARLVDQANAALKQIEKLNGDIARANSGGRDTAALEDQRKSLIDELSKTIPVREVPGQNGALDLITPEGVFLIAGTAREISFTPAAAMGPSMAYDDGAGLLSGLTVAGVNITPGGSGAQTLQSGTLAGLFAVRDEAAPGFQNQLDALARDLIERFEGVDASLAPGDPGLFTDQGLAFDPVNEAGIAQRLRINAAVDPAMGGAVSRLRDGLGAVSEGVAGNATLIHAMLDRLTETRAIPSGAGLGGTLNAAQAAAGITSAIGSLRISSETAATSSLARAQAVIDAESASIGVDTDAELQFLILIEQAFAANARVIQTAQAMIERLMDI